MAAHRLLSGIAIAGLAIGLTGAILMALVVRTAFGFNGAVPDHDRTYLGISMLVAPEAAPNYNQASSGRVATFIRANLPEVEAVARLADEELPLTRDGVRGKASLYWADPDIFDVLHLPVLSGEAGAALARPDGLVMTAAAARRWFGTDDALGRTIEIGGRPMTLRAVLADLPPNASDLTSGIFASGLAAQSALSGGSDGPGSFSIGARTYMRLRAGTDPAAVERRIAPYVEGLLPAPMRGAYSMRLARIDRLALHPGFHPGARERLMIGSLVAALVLFIATANFVNLSVALAGRRRREIGVRKASGASREQIATQFLGEAVLTVFVAACLAMTATEWLLPAVNAFLDTQARFDCVHEPQLLLWLLLMVVVLGLVAGAYPALLLSAFRPAEILKADAGAGWGRDIVRTLLVVGQFAILIGLMVATVVVYQQRSYAMREALRVDIGQMLTIVASCPAGFVQEAGRLPGVRGISCSGSEWLDGSVFAFVTISDRRVQTNMVSSLPAQFALYGLRPVAGALASLPERGETTVSRVAINETAVRQFGFGSPNLAIGREIPVPADQSGPDWRARIVAVVPDFSLTSVETPIQPTIYLDRPFAPQASGLVSVKLAGRAVPETLAAIDSLWRKTGHGDPIDRTFVSAHMEALYRDLTRNTTLFAIFSGLAMALAGLGLVGLSISTADRRTKEIGIRKAMGASMGQVLALLLWQLCRPVLWANLLAWPFAWWGLDRWLSGYAYHVGLRLWLFPAAGLAALAIALLTIGSQTFAIARRKPVTALRYE
jgi:putative ABC transport system permease protein